MYPLILDQNLFLDNFLEFLELSGLSPSFLEKNTPSSQEMQIMQDVGRQATL